jgi:hypothetical protein
MTLAYRASAPSSRAHNPGARNLTGRCPAARFVPLLGGLIPDGDAVDGIENHLRPSTRSYQAMSGDRFPIRVSPFAALPAMVSFRNPQPALSLGRGSGS